MAKIIKRMTIGLGIVLTAMLIQIAYFSFMLPDRYYTEVGKSLTLPQAYLSTSYQSFGWSAVSRTDGERNVSINLLGIIPIKQASVKNIEPPQLIASGHPFGLKMFTSGAMVIGFSDIETKEGNLSPGQDAGIREGDLILSVNKKKISRNEEVGLIIEKSEGQPVSVELERDGEIHQVTLMPVRSSQDETYKGGIWVRDSAAGIGTISFIDPKTGVFAGLGHPICDVDTGTILPVGSGEVCEVSINNIQKGSAGNPGELIGVFTTGDPIGIIHQNNHTGIYGTLFGSFSENKTYPMAFKQDVKVGPASIICCLQNGEPKEYAAQITSINYSEETQIKNMVVKITDPAMLALTGGIVQGMSGTPIIQNGKFVGAITHVFVNNSSKGYGIFAETMYQQALQIQTNP